MFWPGVERNHVGSPEPSVDHSHCIVGRERLGEEVATRCKTEKAEDDDPGNRDGLGAADGVLDPLLCGAMVRAVGVDRVEQNIEVDEAQLFPALQLSADLRGLEAIDEVKGSVEIRAFSHSSHVELGYRVRASAAGLGRGKAVSNRGIEQLLERGAAARGFHAESFQQVGVEINRGSHESDANASRR